MSSSSIIDYVSSSPSIVHDETSNQSIEIPDPPLLHATQISTNNNNNPINNSDNNNDTLPVNITFEWFNEQMRAGVDLRPILLRFLPGLPNDLSQSTIFELLMNIFVPVQQRQPLEQYKTLDDAVELIRKCKNILVLTGAGISVSCGSKFSQKNILFII